ncbi:serine/threonine-protein kinase [Streptomyces sp. NPDC058290]|uniref:serine/threonine-protein kinase n=1 Tax=Streptomyces sp. NPDC058290 TaxID=3346426 RepID=UPI0036E8850F
MAKTILLGRYQLESVLGRGGMGEVWRAWDLKMNRIVAVKRLRFEGDAGDAHDLLRREARTTGAVTHPGVVTVYDYDLAVDEAGGWLVLVMELIKGRDLAKVLHKGGWPTVATALDWSAQAADALAAAHEANVVHRDLKPSNLMLSSEGRVVILDFGIARFSDSTRKASAVMGTFLYMPPERFKGDHGTPRSDLYSLGCVLFEFLTKRTPFSELGGPAALMNAHANTAPDKPGKHRSGIPAELDKLVLALLAKDPANRPESAAEVSVSLRGLLAEIDRTPATPGAEAPPSPGTGCERPLTTTTTPNPFPVAPVMTASVTTPQPPPAAAPTRHLSVPGSVAEAWSVTGTRARYVHPPAVRTTPAQGAGSGGPGRSHPPGEPRRRPSLYDVRPRRSLYASALIPVAATSSGAAWNAVSRFPSHPAAEAFVNLHSPLAVTVASLLSLVLMTGAIATPVIPFLVVFQLNNRHGAVVALASIAGFILGLELPDPFLLPRLL